MVKQYPHILSFIASLSVEATRNEDGDYVIPDPTQSETLNIPCRAEPNDTGRALISNDGVSIQYGYIIYMPIDVPDVHKGALISVTDNGVYLIKDVYMKQFSRGQLNARLWV